MSYCQAAYTYISTTMPSGNIEEEPWIQTLANTWNYVDSNGTWHSSTLVQNDYTYDNNGQRLTNKITAADGSSRTETYGYDNINRLTSVNYGDGETQGYTFDAMGNRLQKTDSATGNEGYTYNAANMLLTRGTGSYTNDLNGNTLTAAAPSGTRTCVWDSENRMVSCVYNGNNCAYTYGADGIRRRGVVNGVTTDYVLDNSMFVQELRAGSPIATSLMGPRGPEYRRDDVAGTVRWYLYDGLGSVLGEVDPSGNLTCSRKYDVYGAVRSFTGTQTSKHRFVGALGHPSEDETGLIYMQARYMDPATGRFVSEDPGRNGENWFTYCDANPVGSVDRDGRDSNPLQWLFELLGTTLVAKFLIDKPLTLGLRNLTSWLGWMSRWLIDGGREQMGQGAVEIEIGNEQDFTPSGFSIAGLSLGSGAMDSTFGASRLALGIILQYVVEYMEYMLDMNPDQ